jgi:malonyl-CoA/methylmalonyl-CoA synthetase
MTEDLFSVLRAGFPSDLRRPAVETDTGAVYSWQDLESGSARMANLLRSLQLPPGARIAAHVEKSVDAAMLYLATLRVGCVFVPLNPAYRNSEMAYFLNDAEPSVVVGGPGDIDWLEPLIRTASARQIYTLGSDGSGTLVDASRRFGEVHADAPSRSGDLAAILYTSGTTGRSKGAMLTHGALAANALVLKQYWAWAADDVLIHALPIFHAHGLFVALHGALLAGSRMIWLSRFDPEVAISSLRSGTVFMGVPTMYVRMLGSPHLDRKAASNMRLFISGSAPLLAGTFEDWKSRTGHTILERYGMSETVMLTSNPYRREADRRAGTVGLPLPGVGLRLRNDADQNVPAGEVGEVEVTGLSVFRGYWRIPEKTREAFTADGWFKTGDMGRLDDRGYLTIVGRDKDLIISGGYNVYPAEIEGYLNELPGVEESAVVGVPHPDLGEVGVAFVVPRTGVALSGEELLADLKGRLANFKIPKRCLVVTGLPRNAMGKVLKQSLRAGYESKVDPLECGSQGRAPGGPPVRGPAQV